MSANLIIHSPKNPQKLMYGFQNKNTGIKNEKYISISTINEKSRLVIGTSVETNPKAKQTTGKVNMKTKKLI